MKHFRHLLVIVAAFVMAVVSCEKAPEEVRVESVSLSQPTAEMLIGESVQLSATVLPSNATDKTVIWASSKQSVATVTESGRVTAIAEGVSTITVSAGGKSATCLVTVHKPYVAVSSVTLNKSELTLVESESETLVATVSPDNASDKTVSWASSNTSIATVSNGAVTAIAPGTATITATAGEKSATCTVTVTKVSSSPEAIDLGLSVKWASYNVGATKPEEYGDHFAWGETSPKNDYTWKTYKWCNGNLTTLTKYNTQSGHGTVDNKTQLEMSDDAAHANWGEKWRMPTKAEFDELKSNCTYTWTTLNGVKGCLVTSKKNGNSIFLPSAGLWDGTSVDLVGSYGYCWSSSLYMDPPSYAWLVSSNDVGLNTHYYPRIYGLPVRPVYGDLISVTSVSLSETTLTLEVGKTATLTATVKPDNATDKTVSWVSSNTEIAKVLNGTVTAIAPGAATITATAGNKSATCTVTVTKASSSPEAIDLGLSVKWASFNVGATTPEEYGDYFAWGETSPKKDYSWSTYKWSNGSEYTLTKYNTSSSYGTVDNKTQLEMSDDAARANWGGKWRMPTKAEFDELKSNCTYTWTTLNGVKGCLVTSKKNGNSIFLPSAGLWDGTSVDLVGSYGYCWSSSLYMDPPSYAWLVSSNDVGLNTHYYPRIYGLPVRPVYGDLISVTSVSLSETTLTLEVGKTATLTATVKPDNATDKKVTWTSSNTSVATVSSGGLVKAIATGTATITAKAGDKSATCTVTVTQASSSPEAIDLGLSVKWASFNVGAPDPAGFGDHFAWGETSPKKDYSWSTYKWCNGSENTLTKYNNSSSYGTVDDKIQLELSDDAARANWGGNWRMPTKLEIEELLNNCTWTKTNRHSAEGHNVDGYLVTSKKNGNSIYISSTFWSSSLYTNTDYPSKAWFMRFKSGNRSVGNQSRCDGLCVRPVYDDFAVTSVSLSESSLYLLEGQSVTLTATVYSTDAKNIPVMWTTSDKNVATVSSDGLVSAKSVGTATIMASAGGKYATCYVKVSYAVDLGLPSGIRWADCNVGASEPEEYGNYFAWGETSPKKDYGWYSYKWCNMTYTTLTKYNNSSSYGTVDNKTQLEMSDDAARANWGGKWRMPTKAEFEELHVHCKWTWTTRNGVNGYLVTSKKNENSIFLPAAGYTVDDDESDVGIYGYYWSSSLDTGGPSNAWRMRFKSSNRSVGNQSRCVGLSVRPVYDE